jgi:hypothetical protein
VYSEHVVEDGWEPAPWPPEVSCAMTDLRWGVYTAIGAVVVVMAIGAWAAKRIIRRR